MEKLIILNSTAVPLPAEDIDTDQIIPARFLKAVTREGFGDNLFRDWRYDGTEMPVRDFVLNNPMYKGRILIAGRNFGCGSSREHAAWALYDYGFRAVISSFFADIFKGNALNNGLLPVEISDVELQFIFTAIETNPTIEIEINLPEQKLSVPTMDWIAQFEIDGYKKLCLINGYDDIDYLLSIKNKILEYEERAGIN
ncbi:MAG TPA: 3-isopropylmalate dehydratase small subunit [Saprospiraceae bacterium]|nr:3-isopropylmalate dehydratase small subunit [Saprospiraceae bacterium]